jgi:phosphate starvation-inducible membrane PsiE
MEKDEALKYVVYVGLTALISLMSYAAKQYLQTELEIKI